MIPLLRNEILLNGYPIMPDSLVSHTHTYHKSDMGTQQDQKLSARRIQITETVETVDFTNAEHLQLSDAMPQVQV